MIPWNSSIGNAWKIVNLEDTFRIPAITIGIVVFVLPFTVTNPIFISRLMWTWKLVGTICHFPQTTPLFHFGTKNGSFNFTEEPKMMRDEQLLILKGGSNLFYDGAGWTCIVSTPTPKSIQDSRCVKWNWRSMIVYLLRMHELYIYIESSRMDLWWIGFRSIGPFGRSRINYISKSIAFL